jgi:CRISPR-associated endoribonuclease Cas6
MFDFQFKQDTQEYVMKNATLTLSTSNPHIGVAFFNGLSKTNNFSHLKCPLKITSKQMAREQTIISYVATFSILNSILIEDKNKKPLLINDSNFEKELNIVTNKQFQSLYGRTLHEPLKIYGHRLKKQVIKETNRHAQDKVLFFTGQKGELILQGHPEDLQLIYQDGLGLRKSQDFGLLEVLNHG